MREMWQEACATALASLPKMGPTRLSAFLLDLPPEAAWQLLASGAPLPMGVTAACAGAPGVIGEWRSIAKKLDPMELFETYQAAGVDVWTRFTKYPWRLAVDPEAPAVLFSRGDITALDLPSVAIIGTRHCSQEGRSVARKFAAELAEAGVCVVSGLALGIDGAAHEGALSAAFGAAPVGVVGSGLNVPYPKRHADLWRRVAAKGALLSEAPLEAIPEPWRFPARNRIIAGLAHVMLVVESHDRGGSLITVDQAIERDVTIMAVPGSVRNPAARGTNRLLADMAVPALSTEDVLRELQWVVDVGRPPVEDARGEVHAASVIDVADLPPLDTAVLRAIDFGPTTTDEILTRTELSLGDVAAALGRLRSQGCISGESGWWRRLGADEAGAD